ncbi:zincin-like metallopeptidase domain-containing protein [Mucilaginibacter sp. KACC 22773]|uniref:zincin-like metallopeptidase domain-containing protein n=1 Tax=Mucilaginibacter sp. KACC 22773 TaxID=3025671 RepID=UPI002365C0CA|nr:zincin-like metallopeptidase domain-containing protein [Mucilaginibacter sp. KACC 22773]WDF77033.1 zincin-like metallopeptidase domain-containing protein [Mucilaginibacter sp. KACC 22773]
MSKNFKALPVQLSDKLIAEIKEGNSLFQKPVKDNGLPAFVTPVNPTTGKGYSAMNALILGMQRHDDPRWMSADAARYAGNWVKKDEKGTLIEFPKTSDIQAIRTAEGDRIKKDGVTQTKTVEFDKPQRGQAFLFNAEQMNDIMPLEEFLQKQDSEQKLDPTERATKLIQDSKAIIIHGGQEAFYDKQRDAIFLPEPEEFDNEVKYLQVAIHQLAHWTGHEDRLNRPMEGKFGSMDYAREEMRAAIAAVLIGGELKIGHNFGQQAAYMNTFAKILKDEPFEIAKASRDAQKIANLLLGVNQKREQKQGAEAGFKKGDEIAYMDTTYKVLETYKTKSIKVEDAEGTRKVLKPEYGLYKSLLEAKTNPRESEMVLEEEQGQSEELGQQQKIGR